MSLTLDDGREIDTDIEWGIQIWRDKNMKVKEKSSMFKRPSLALYDEGENSYR